MMRLNHLFNVIEIMIEVLKHSVTLHIRKQCYFMAKIEHFLQGKHNFQVKISSKIFCGILSVANQHLLDKNIRLPKIIWLLLHCFMGISHITSVISKIQILLETSIFLFITFISLLFIILLHFCQSSPASGKAKLISRMAKMGKPMLPMTGAVPVQPDSDSDSQVRNYCCIHHKLVQEILALGDVSSV